MRRAGSKAALISLILALVLWAFGASAFAGDRTCMKVSELCVEGPSTKVIGGQSITRECWVYRNQFDCVSSAAVNDCAPLIAQGCFQVGSSCLTTLANGQCSLYEQSYSCKVADGQSTTITNCGNQSFCFSGNCFDASHPADADFAKAVALMEAEREAGKYLDPYSLQVFKGYDNRCRKKLFGLVNCCNGAGSSGSLFSNLNLILGAGGQVMGAVGSSYTYDALFTSDAPDMVIAGFEALFGAGGGSSALAGLLAGDLSVASFVGTLVPGPWTIAMLAIQLSGILSCEQAEQILAMKRDNRLCHGVGSYCSSRLPIIRLCVETTESYCCFNSRLSRILNEQGRGQLGRGWGGPESPDCSGFTVAQLQSLDFSRMNLAEFYAEIAPRLPDVGAMRSRAQQRINSYFGP